MQNIFFIILAFYSAALSSQENTSQTPATTAKIDIKSDADLLIEAKIIIGNNKTTNSTLTSEIFRISQNNNNHPLSALAHNLLGHINQQSQNFEQSIHHYLQAAVIYQKLNDHKNHIASSIDYINILLTQKHFEKAYNTIDKTLPTAKEHRDLISTALLLTAKGDGYYSQEKYNDAINQYTELLNYLSSNTQRIQELLGETFEKIALSYSSIKDRKQASDFYIKSLGVYTALRDKKSMARTLHSIARAERQLGHLVIALEYSMRSLDIHKQIDDPDGRAEALVVAGIIYRLVGRYEKSLEQVYEAHLYYKKINDINKIADTSNQLGMIFTRLEQFDQSRSFYQLSIDLSDQQIEPYFLATASREMAVIDWNTGNYNSALKMAEKALSIYEAEGDKLKKSLTNRIIANIYRGQEDIDNAIIFYRRSISLALEIDNKLYQIKAQTALAGILIGLNNKEAITLLNKSLELCFELNDKKQALYAYRNLQEAEKQQGNYGESLKYAEEVIALTTFLQDKKDKNNLILTKANLNSHKIETELQSLKEKAKFNQLELAKMNSEIEIAKQARTITELELVKNKYASIALALLLAICSLLVILTYRRFILSKKRNKELNYLAERDPLTNSYNRRILFDHLNRDFFTKPELLDEYCIIMVDIDHFKNVNDTYGHSAGDSVLIGVANILQGCIRQNDIVARFGGEEFCIILHWMSENKAMSVAEIMRSKIEKSRFDEIKITSSFGVTSIKFNAKSPTELIDQADAALYQSKFNGRNKVTLWDKTFEKKV